MTGPRNRAVRLTSTSTTARLVSSAVLLTGPLMSTSLAADHRVRGSCAHDEHRHQSASLWTSAHVQSES